jgi:hypothetical protein
MNLDYFDDWSTCPSCDKSVEDAQVHIWCTRCALDVPVTDTYVEAVADTLDVDRREELTVPCPWCEEPCSSMRVSCRWCRSVIASDADFGG